MVEILGSGREMQFLGGTGWKYHQFRVVITVVSAPGARDAAFHPQTPKMLKNSGNDNIINHLGEFLCFWCFGVKSCSLCARRENDSNYCAKLMEFPPRFPPKLYFPCPNPKLPPF